MIRVQEILKAENIVKEFHSGGSSIRILNGVSLKLDPGESLSIVGPSGSGKSTLLSILAGLDRPTEGTVEFRGMNLGSLDENEISKLWGKSIGFVFQFYHLLPALSALENVRTPLEIAGDPDAESKSQEWLSRVGLSSRGHHRPSQLSGGEQQRVALARAMISSPDILFADEPLGNLDTKSGHEMGNLLFSLVSELKTTLVLVTHDTSFAEKADRVLVLEDGKIV